MYGENATNYVSKDIPSTSTELKDRIALTVKFELSSIKEIGETMLYKLSVVGIWFQ